MIEVMTDLSVPDKVRLTIRGHDVWITTEEARKLRDYISVALEPMILPDKRMKLYQLYYGDRHEHRKI